MGLTLPTIGKGRGTKTAPKKGVPKQSLDDNLSDPLVDPLKRDVDDDLEDDWLPKKTIERQNFSFMFGSEALYDDYLVLKRAAPELLDLGRALDAMCARSITLEDFEKTRATKMIPALQALCVVLRDTRFANTARRIYKAAAAVRIPKTEVVADDEFVELHTGSRLPDLEEKHLNADFEEMKSFRKRDELFGGVGYKLASRKASKARKRYRKTKKRHDQKLEDYHSQIRELTEPFHEMQSDMYDLEDSLEKVRLKLNIGSPVVVAKRLHELLTDSRLER